MRRQIVTRRQFLRGTGTAAGVALLGAPLFDVGTALAAPPLVRYDIGSLSPSSPIIVSYSKAIGAMKALPPGDPRSWSYQAAIHGTTAMPTKMAWNTCEHGTYFFWSWHRMYIYWFERIVRKMSGNPGWTLPFWNWSSPTERQLPAVFRDPTSELYTPNRKPAMNSGAGSLPPSDVNYAGALSLSNFASASSSLEGTPHGTVHVDIGGWMGSVPTAAQDPIFYLHHCNIDRLWSLWLTLGGTRSNPLSDAAWKDTQFTFFDENAAPVKMTSCDVLRAAQQLNYTYKGEPPQVNQNCVRVAKVPRIFKRQTLLQLPIPPVVLDADPVSFNFDIKPLRRQLALAASSKTQTVFLELDDVEADRPPGVVWEVYVGLPPKAEPDPKSVYYVGNVVLFGSGIKSEGHEFKPAHFALPISKAILSLLRQPKDQVPVTFVAHDVLIDGKLTRPKPESPARIGRVSLTVETQSGP